MYVMTIFFMYFPILLSLSLSFVLHTMINWFKKHIHSFLGLARTFNTNNTTDNYKLHLQCHHPVSSLAVDVINDMVKPAPPPPSLSAKRDTTGGVGFFDGGVDDGLMSCTESLGFESSDERRVDDQIDEIDNKDGVVSGGCWRRMRAAEGRGDWRKVKSFPPPLSSLNMNGQPSFFLLPVRKNGRLVLTEVRIQRPEILYASRQDGRLRLHLIPDQSFLDDDVEDVEEGGWEEEEQEFVEEAPAVAQVEEEIILEPSEEEEEEGDGEVVEDIRYEKEERRVGDWKFPIGSNEGFRRCHVMMNQRHQNHGSYRHHYHHLPMCGVSIA